MTDKFDILKRYPISNWDWPRPVVFIPWMQALPYADKVLPNFLEIARSGVPFIPLDYGYAERVHNLMGFDMLASDYTHVIILDSDHRHPANIVQHLCRYVIDDPEKKIVGGLNYRRTPPYSPCVLVEYDGKLARPVEWEGGLHEVESIGTANIMISREIFEKIEPPWFLNEYSAALHTTGGYDTYFCNKVRAAGYKIWCDFSLCSPHAVGGFVTEQTFRSYLAMNPIPEEELFNVKVEG
jgi:hypothetical protein